MAVDDIRIETERMILRPPNGDDFESWAAFQADAKTMTHIGGLKSRAQSWRDLCAMIGAWHVRGYAMFSLILKDSGQWIGRIGPWYPDGWPGTEVGWGVAPDYTIDPENIASIKLAERLGSTNRGPTKLPDPYQNARVDDWGQSRDQWMQNRKMFQ